MTNNTRCRVDFEDVFILQAERFVPLRSVSVGEVLLEKGEPVRGGTKIAGRPLYSLIGTVLEVEDLDQSIWRLHLPE